MIPASFAAPLSTQELIAGFYQGASNNCASIAAIKAALKLYGGAERVLANAVETTDGLVITLRDSTKLVLTAGELARATEASAFKGENKQLLAHAWFLYAIMANTYAARHFGSESAENTERALKVLSTNGLYWSESVEYLGLTARRHIVFDTRIPHPSLVRQTAAGVDACIAQNAWHAWFACEGLHDHRGVAQSAPFKLSSGILRLV